MAYAYRTRHLITALLALVILGSALVINRTAPQPVASPSTVQSSPGNATTSPAIEALQTLAVKGRAPKTDYTREQFGAGWTSLQGCDTRNIILRRDLTKVQLDVSCHVVSGQLNDPYTGRLIAFVRGSTTSSDIQIDHVVALSDAWQKGAQQLPKDKRIELANDPLELLAVDGPTNQQKSDGDAATWLPANKAFRCQYVSRQIAVKQKYTLWVTQAEHEAMAAVLQSCPDQPLPKA